MKHQPPTPALRKADPHLFKVRDCNALLFIASVILLFSYRAAAQSPVVVTVLEENIPTYLSGPPDPNPMFFFGRGTQGAEQRIYPYPLYDNLTNKKGDKIYQLVYLENEYVKIGILPELGGRIFSALDKTNNYDFIYKQHVVKPALIGLLGAWISGGLEWNVPHHHRASTFSPVQYKIENGADGSKTVWVGELEIRHRMRWAVGYTLKPGSSILSCNVRINNRTPLENTMLSFANIAVAVNKDYQVIFPPNTQWSTGHSKRDFKPWPIVDGADMSWYKNNKSANSWFAVNDKDDFVAGYDHGKNAGILNIANHHVAAGKKFFTWGVGNIWDKILTDDDGPYLEIMVGAYSDNQPDYSWLQPNEERSYVMSLFPFRGIDGVKNANLEAAVNLEIMDKKAVYGFYTTKAFPRAIVSLKAGNKILSEERISISPSKPYTKEVVLPAGYKENELRASISGEGRELIAYSPVILKPTAKPVAYTEPKRPEQIENTEELSLAGQRIDQFHNPTLDADPYWKEVLKRDPGNISANKGMGLISLRKAKYHEAEDYFSKAVDRLTARYTSPKDVEAHYYLGLTQKEEGKLDSAFTTLYKATWKQEWKAPAFYLLAEIASSNGDHSTALDLANQSLDANAYNSKAYVLKSAQLRHLNQSEESRRIIAFAQEKCDPLDAQLMAEEWLATKDDEAGAQLFSTLKEHPANAQEVASGYLNSGLWKDGTDVLLQLVSETNKKSAISPMVYYYLGYFAERMGNVQDASNYRELASLQPLDYVFPYQREVIPVLRSAIKQNPKDARAPYYLGNFLYDLQPEEAIALWETSLALDPNAPITSRNLAIAYMHEKREGAIDRAVTSMERAVAVADPYPTHFAELDQLYKLAGTPVDKRLAIMERNQSIVAKKDEALGALINLKIFSGQVDEAILLLQSRIFSIWEGGGDFNTGQAWADAHLMRGLNHFNKKDYGKALIDFQAALTPPENLRAERRSPRATQIKYWTASALNALGQKEEAAQLWNQVAAEKPSAERSRSRFSATVQIQRYYAALAKKWLNSGYDADVFFSQISDTSKNTSFASESNQDYQFTRQNTTASLDERAYPYYLAGLGYLGLGNSAKAKDEFNAALRISPDFLSAKIELNQLK